MILIETPDNRHKEREYVFQVLLKTFLGLEYRVIHSAIKDHIKITKENCVGEVFLADTFFTKSIQSWLQVESLPKRPLTKTEATSFPFELSLPLRTVPVIFGQPVSDGDYAGIKNNSIMLGLDIFGSAFYMLTRYEEYVSPIRDEFGRFPLKESLANKEGFIERPIINEYIEILWACLKKTWPGLARKKRTFRVVPTHDVDNPYKFAFTPLMSQVITAAKTLKNIKSIPLAVREITNWAKVQIGQYESDPFNNYEWIMEQSEKNAINSIFYFMAASPGKFDQGYPIDSPVMIALIKRVVERGHTVGFHPSYASSEDPELLNIELEKIESTLREAGISNEMSEVRQHYLSIKSPDALALFDDLGFKRDSTLGYAETPGFRSGICYEYPFYDIRQNKILRILELPLTVMDCTLFHENYLHLDEEGAIEKLTHIKRMVRRYNGDFVFLWHNNNPITDSTNKIYQALISEM